MAQNRQSAKAYIDPSRCDQSPFCPVMRACPARAIEMKGGGLFGFGGTPVVNAEKCTGCGACTRFCPHNAVRLK